jgi:hypothetical protein
VLRHLPKAHKGSKAHEIGRELYKGLLKQDGKTTNESKAEVLHLRFLFLSALKFVQVLLHLCSVSLLAVALKQ